MNKFRKKPVVIEALYYDGANLQDVADFLGASLPSRHDDMIGLPISIPPLEGDMWAEVGYWIIKGTAGEFYPCKPNIFAQTYEPVEDDT